MSGTAVLEHFFGLARTIPDFTVVQFFTLAKHVTLQRRIVLSRKYQPKKDSHAKSRSGYVFDFDTAPLSAEQLAFLCVRHLLHDTLSVVVNTAHLEAHGLAKDILHMAVRAQISLAPLSGTKRASGNTALEAESDTESEHEDEDTSYADGDDGLGELAAASRVVAQDETLEDLLEEIEDTMNSFGIDEDEDDFQTTSISRSSIPGRPSWSVSQADPPCTRLSVPKPPESTLALTHSRLFASDSILNILD